MSGSDRVNSVSPFLVLIWIFQLIILVIDWQDGGVSWSIPIIGSFLLVQVYMVWKTNSDEIMQEQTEAMARSLGGPMDTPMINPNQTDLRSMYSSKEETKRSGSVNINIKAENQDQ